MRSIRRLVERLQRREPDAHDLLLEYAVIVSLIAVVVVLVLVLAGDSISDLVALIGGRVDDATLGH